MKNIHIKNLISHILWGKKLTLGSLMGRGISPEYRRGVGDRLTVKQLYCWLRRTVSAHWL